MIENAKPEKKPKPSKYSRKLSCADGIEARTPEELETKIWQDLFVDFH